MIEPQPSPQSATLPEARANRPDGAGTVRARINALGREFGVAPPGIHPAPGVAPPEGEPPAGGAG